MPPFRQFRDDGKLVIHGDSFSLPGDLEMVRSPPTAGIPSPDHLHLFANEITVDGTVYNGGADISITCRVLKLVEGATFDLSAPDQKETFSSLPRAGQYSFGLGRNGKMGNAGLPGYKAGTLSILCGKVVQLGQPPDSTTGPAVGRLWKKPEALEKALDESFKPLKNGSKTRGPWVVVHAVGGKGGKGQDGQSGGHGRNGAKGKELGVIKTKNWGVHSKAKFNKLWNAKLEEYRKECKGENGKNGGKGGRGGTGGTGGSGGDVRFAVADGSYSTPDASVPESDWEPTNCVLITNIDGGASGAPGEAGKGGSKGARGQGGNFDITVHWTLFKKTIFVKDEPKTHKKKDRGPPGIEGKNGNSGTDGRHGVEGSTGSGHGEGGSFEEDQLLGMLDVDHLLQLERAAGKVSKLQLPGHRYLRCCCCSRMGCMSIDVFYRVTDSKKNLWCYSVCPRRTPWGVAIFMQPRKSGVAMLS